MLLIKEILKIIEFVVFIYLGGATGYLFIFGVAGLFRYRQKHLQAKTLRKIAVLIPGYKEDTVIIETAGESLRQNYPADMYDVFIIADSFRPDTLQRLRKLEVQVIEVSFEKSSKAKALNKAMSLINSDYQIAVVLDADNFMAHDFLEQVNQAFEQGHQVVQGHRVAKNLNTGYAILDAISEEINNHIFRKGHRVLGLSSALIGSGMAFSYDLYKKIMLEVTAHGEDKELEVKLLMNGINIEYLHHTLVFDEKVQKVEIFAKQRKRWLSAQLVSFRNYFGIGLKQLFLKGNIDLFDKLIQMILPPRILHIGSITMLLLLFSLRLVIPALGQWFSIPLPAWMILWSVTFVSLLVSVPRKFYNMSTLRALKELPGAFFTMFSLLFKLRGADKTFIHTTHGTTNK
jgi:cellulose synthase/poly-beta-1,6-N-acetylglucosamine synthase-like glycosyltransferase